MDLLGVPIEAIRLGLSEADTTKTEAPAIKRRLRCCYRAYGLNGFYRLNGRYKAFHLFILLFFHFFILE